jgi:DnaJ-domain-containing protein 1
MGIIDRLSTVLRSYLGGEDTSFSDSRERFGDPDLNAAWEELDDFLGKGRQNRRPFEEPEDVDFSGGKAGRKKRPPEELRADFAELGLPHGAPLEECKAAYKRLLNLHHPDRHAGHAANLKKATEKSARINAAWDRIKRWAETGRF